MEANEGWLGERAEWRQGARLASSPPGNHKGPASRGDHGPANPWYPLKRTDIVWPALWCLKISIPLGNLSCCGYQGEKMIWWCKVSFGRREDSFSCHCKSIQAFILIKCVFTNLLPCYQSGAKVIVTVYYPLATSLLWLTAVSKVFFNKASTPEHHMTRTNQQLNKQAGLLSGWGYLLTVITLNVGLSPKIQQ